MVDRPTKYFYIISFKKKYTLEKLVTIIYKRLI